MQFSHSRIGVFKSCPYKYKLQYIDKVKTILNADSNKAVILGTNVDKLDEANKTIIVNDGAIKFDKLVIATGS
ncbi:PD-(D/E)XK nuclease family protein, partial [Clostridioides difficile]|uniref:PD-(D/E)XK nuclease family protein n=1 Tax=Clostridioides difficile TaxID=1496 RepID=UPI001CA49DCA